MATVIPEHEVVDEQDFIILIPDSHRYHTIYVPLDEVDDLIENLLKIKNKIDGSLGVSSSLAGNQDEVIL